MADEFIARGIEVGERLDLVLQRHHPERSRSAIQQWILRGLVTVDGRQEKPGFRLRPAQLIRYDVPPYPAPVVVPQPIPLDVVYDDQDIVVVNKPAGMVVHPAGPLRTGTLVNALQHRYGARPLPGGPDRPGIVHRLDKGTSGLMVAALSECGYQRLVAQIAERRVSRVYLAVVWGSVAVDGGAVDRPVGRSSRDRTRMAAVPSGKPALTSFIVRRRWGVATELQLSLHTGRTHQIRVHMAWTGHPVVGDGDYGGRRSALSCLSPSRHNAARELLRMIERPALHAWRLEFVHPVDGRRMEFEADPPSDYMALRAALDERWPDRS